MTLTVQPTQEAYFYKEVRKIQPESFSNYSGYAIYHLHRRISNTESSRVNQLEYWKPLPALQAYREYTEGDEFVNAERIFYEPRIEVGGKPRKRYYVDKFPVYTHKYCGLKLYVATNRTKPYPLLSSTNPYSYKNIQEWIESPETYEETFDSYGNLIVPSYWYHPFRNLFYPFGTLPIEGINDTQFLIDSIFSRDTSGQSNESLMANAVESIKSAQIDELISQGRTRENATALVNAQSQAALATRAAQALPGISSRISTNTNNQLIQVNVSRSSSLNQGSLVSIPASQNPTLLQTNTSGREGLRYEFRHRPNQISYTSIGSDWTPIERAANRPMIDWKSYKLMSVSFSFIVAPDESGSLDAVIDGKVITTSVDNELRTLRQMASSPFPVTFFGFDKLLSEPARYPFNNDGGGKGSLFVIADLNVTSIYRSSTGSISRASCDITLTEYPKELIKLIEFPKLKPIPEVPPPPPGEKPICDGTLASTTFKIEGREISRNSSYLRNLATLGVINFDEKCSSIIILNVKAWENAERNFTEGRTDSVVSDVPWSELVTP